MKRTIAAVAIAICAFIAAYASQGPHEFKESDCMRCHADPEGEPLRLMSDVSSLCMACHKRGMKNASHPINVKPSVAVVPKDMPLRDGKIACSTCHNIHAERYTPYGEKSYFLRRPFKGREFCIACHNVNPLLIGHETLLGSAHVGRKYKTVDLGIEIDPLSISCIQCHDGSTGSNAEYIIGAGVMEHPYGAHPIGVDYRLSRMENGGLKPISQLDGRIRLFGGKIGCGTCHEPYSKESKMLVMNNNGSALCLECHYNK